jgi:hypothetical protein
MCTGWLVRENEGLDEDMDWFEIEDEVRDLNENLRFQHWSPHDVDSEEEIGTITAAPPAAAASNGPGGAEPAAAQPDLVRVNAPVAAQQRHVMLEGLVWLVCDDKDSDDLIDELTR